MKALPFLLVVACLVIAAIPAGAQGPDVNPGKPPIQLVPAPGSPLRAPVAQPPALPKEPGTPGLQAALDRLVKASAARGPLAMQELAAQEGIPLDGGQVLVVVEGQTALLPAALEEFGGQIDAVGDGFAALLAPVAALPAVAALDGVEYVRLPKPGYPLETPDYRDAKSEGVAVLGAADWHAAEFLGQGINVAVIDGGFYDWMGLQADGDLPQNTICVNDWSSQPDCGHDRATQIHGSACAQILHDVSPGVEALYLYPFQYDYQIPLIVQDMIDKEIDIASMSWGWDDGEPNDGTGFISSAVNMAKEDGGIFFTATAGNLRLRHWEGYFSDSAQDPDSCHDFDPNLAEPTRFLNILNLVSGQAGDILNPTSGRFSAALVWDDWPTTDQDYDLYLYELVGGAWEIADSSTDTQDGDDRPTELIRHGNLASGYYALAICAKGEIEPDGYLELFTWHADQDYRYRVEASSLVEPATADGAMAMAAFHWEFPDNLEDFSSLGPRNPQGGGPFLPDACDGPTADCKPDFAGPDQVQITFDGLTYRLRGTSAAAPHLAGAAALVMSAYNFGADETYGLLRDRALAQPDPLPSTLGSPLSTTMNKGWGWGRLWLGDHPGITAVDVASFQATPMGVGILVGWETTSELGLQGFNLLRSDQPEGKYTLLNQELIPSEASSATLGASYSWLDSAAEPGTRYFYRLETQELHAKPRLFGPVSAEIAANDSYRLALPLVISD